MPTSEAIGLVLRVDAKLCHVEVDGTPMQVPLLGRLFEERSWEKNPVAVGDRVRLRLDVDGGAIEQVLPRTSKLARRAKGEEDREQVIAANVTLVLIITSFVEPPLQPALVDRILVGAERQSLPAAIVFTKLDRDKKGRGQQWVDLYRGLGYRVFATSVAPGRETLPELTELADLLHHNVTVLTGLSGVGKSSLINHLIPGLNLRIGDMSRIRQGKHTTSHTRLIPLPGGGYVLDTPGIRNFGLFAVDPSELTFWFKEFAPVARNCAYRNCSHRDEPDCAVRAAVEAGEIHGSRYESYVRLYEDLLDG